MLRFATFLIFSLVSFFAASEEIKKIEINGLSSLSKGTVLSYLPVEIGDDFNDLISDISLQKLYETGLFEDIKISQTNGIVNIVIYESPVIKYFDVKGFKNDRVLNEDVLKSTLSDIKLSSGNLFRKNIFEKFINQLKDEYKASGHYKADIKVKVDKDLQNRIGIEVNIDEGEVARIRSFRLKGNEKFDNDFLLNFFTIGEPDIFFINFFTEKDFFSQFEFDAGLQKIKSHYIASGFLEFEILNSSVQISENKEEINLLVEIHEGPQYKIRDINFKGDFLNVPEEQIMQLLGISSGQIFKNKDLISGLQEINNYFGDQGFAFSKINADTNENKDLKEVNITIDINVNDRIYINRIIITGNTRTQYDVIRREINLFEGQQYSKSELDKSISNIKRLAFFKNVEMKSSRLADDADKVDIFIEVDENKTGELSIGLSQSNTTGAAFTFGIKERNFLGTGNVLNAGLINSEAVEEVSFFFSNPDFLGKNHTLSYGVTSRKVDSKYIDLNSYTLNTLGVNASYGIPISEYAKFNNGFNIETLDLECGSIYLFYENSQCSDNSSKLNFSLISSVNENSLNDSMFPTSGKKSNVRLELGLPLADFLYYKFDIDHSSYYPVGENLTLKLGSKLGFIDTYNDKETPFYRKYFGGGSTSIRGFDLNSLGPKYSNGSVKGGEVSLLGTSSIISPLSFIDNSNNMRVGAFVDIGSITESVDQFDTSDIRASTGIAFSWYTPIGPIGINYSKPIISKSSDNIENFSFTLGASF